VTRLPLAEYDYEYPSSLIAASPADPRDSSRLLVLERATGAITHSVFRELPKFLKAGDCLVLNRTKVIPCRLLGKKSTGGKADLLLVRELGPARWAALASGFKTGQSLEFPGGLSARVTGLSDEGEYLLEFAGTDVRAVLAEHGLPPLPPYIAKLRIPSRADAASYQTVYARDEGSIAAPTAGLHFTPDVFRSLEAGGVSTAWLTLHVGRGTFRPILKEDADAHVMLPERYEVDEAEALRIAAARRGGGRVVAVGTTATRTLETVAREPKSLRSESSLYIRPGHRFLAVDALLTNFHLPRSTPLLLVCAFAGRENILRAYREAVERSYRLFSFGDAMLIL
jgi:S-adenosylmethionine:tRNA ribosyltransferase-isomerase